MEKLLIATKNAGKAREYRSLFEPRGFEVITLNDLPEKVEIIENGQTFVENATIKAKALADKYQLPVLADDSGLAIDHLDGAPGIYSARYAGDHDDEANKQKVLTELMDVPSEKRAAHFHCAIVVYAPFKEPLVAQGQVDGIILEAPQGENGFGYDPLFYYPPFKKSFAQLTMAQKNSVSHRGRAVTELMRQFDQWWKVGK